MAKNTCFAAKKLTNYSIDLKLYHEFIYVIIQCHVKCCPDGLSLRRMYVGSVCLPIILVAVAAMILCVAQTCVLIVEYGRMRYQMNPLQIYYYNIYCILQSDTVLLHFGLFGLFENPLAYSFTILQQQQSFAVTMSHRLRIYFFLF